MVVYESACDCAGVCIDLFVLCIRSVCKREREREREREIDREREREREN